MERDPQGVEGINIRRKSVNARLHFGLETPKPAIPDDEDSRMIAIDVLRVGGVVYAVMRRRVDDQLEYAHMPDHLCMYPKLVEQADGLHRKDHDGLESRQRHPQPENERTESAGPSLPQGRAQVIALRRMMHHM